jgi:hypothetical protein
MGLAGMGSPGHAAPQQWAEQRSGSSSDGWTVPLGLAGTPISFSLSSGTSWHPPPPSPPQEQHTSIKAKRLILGSWLPGLAPLRGGSVTSSSSETG